MKIQYQTAGRISSAVFQLQSGQGSSTAGITTYPNTLIPVSVYTSFINNPQYIATLPIIPPVPQVNLAVPTVTNGQEVNPFI